MANTEVLASGRLQDDHPTPGDATTTTLGGIAHSEAPRVFPNQGAIEFRIEKALQRSPCFGETGWWLSHLLLVGNILLILMVNDG